MDNSIYSEQTKTQNKPGIQEIQHDLSQSVNTVGDSQNIEEYPQLTEPTYWLSYEYQKISEEITNLNEKIDLILLIIKKKPRKNTISEVSTKVDCIIEKLNKRRKIESEEVDQ